MLPSTLPLVLSMDCQQVHSERVHSSKQGRSTGTCACMSFALNVDVLVMMSVPGVEST